MSTSKHNHPEKDEVPGPITADSLAAESVRAGGKFADNKDSQPLGVKGGNSTFANTDTSAASKLQAAPDAEARLAEAEWGNGRPQTRSQTKPQGHGQAKTHEDAHQHNQSKSVAGSGSGSGSGSGQGNSSGSSVPTAPHYIDPVLGNMQGSKPKGKNLTEGGFNDDPSKNVSFNTDIGSKEDPGLQAEREIENMNAQNVSGQGLMSGGEKKTSSSYDVLGSEQDA
ncbi:uncharacterized protein GIQ15_00282 [Arthroderma uncinatum]|uniref:uncharacterized protein n=1 Tax=Arthroderma uncinatum TaxID=74035 RepID=UPI00144A577C|nr:uncharacterized protein GIQ15_00282 [Arthroderma uncinatum]KAF3490765.1 hypothetical protein GIQ15_00282 [Arthroderma uncinatum]